MRLSPLQICLPVTTITSDSIRKAESGAYHILSFLRLMKLQLTCVHYYIYVTSQFAALQLNSGRLPESAYQHVAFLQKLGSVLF